jgi:hypothetical protein
MISRQPTAGITPPGLPFQLLMATCGLDAGLVAPFHLFTRTRGYFENAMPFDFVLIGIGVLVGITILSVFKGRSFWILVVGAAGMAIVSFLTIVQYPVLEYANQTLPRITFFGIESQPMAANFAAITCLAILLCGGTFDVLSRSSPVDSTLLFPAALVFGAGIHFFATMFLPSTTGLMASLAGSAIGLVTLLGKGSGAFQAGLEAISPPLAASRGRKVCLGISAVISWLLAVGLEIIALIVFFGTMRQPGDLINGSLLFSNVIAGAAIAALIAAITARWRLLGGIVAITVGGAGMALLFAMASTGALVTFPVIVLGIPLVLPASYVVSELFSLGARGTTGVLLLVGWLVSGYLAFIPIKIPDLMTFSDWIYYAVASALVVEIILAVLRWQLMRSMTPRPGI